MDDKLGKRTKTKAIAGTAPKVVKPYLASTLRKNRAYRHQQPYWLIVPYKNKQGGTMYSPPRIGA